MNATRARTYRFSARDAAGLLLGLQTGQCIILGSGIVASGALLNIGAQPLLVLAPIVLAIAVAFGRLRGEPTYILLPIAATWALARRTGRGQWLARVPRFRSDGSPVLDQPSLPPAFGSLEISELADADWARRGRVRGRGGAVGSSPTLRISSATGARPGVRPA